MSVGRALEGWDSVQRQGQDIAERFSSLAQELGGMIQSHMRSSGIPSQPLNQSVSSSVETGSDSPCSDQQCTAWDWPWIVKRRRANACLNRVRLKGKGQTCTFPADDKFSGAAGIQELGQRLGQAGADLGACLGGFVHHAVNGLYRPLRGEAEPQSAPDPPGPQSVVTLEFHGDYMEWKEVDEAGKSENRGRVAVGAWKQFTNSRLASNGRHRRPGEQSRYSEEATEVQDASKEELLAFLTKPLRQLHRQGSLSVTTTATFDSRTQDIESSVVARGDLWRAEASHGGNASGNGPSPLFLLQIGPILFVRDATLLLPIHLSKQHLLWYGFDRKDHVVQACLLQLSIQSAA